MAEDFSIDTRKSELISDSFKFKKGSRLLFIRMSDDEEQVSISKDDLNTIVGITNKVKNNNITEAILFVIKDTINKNVDENLIEKFAVGRMTKTSYSRLINLFYKDKLIVAPVYKCDLLGDEKIEELILLECWNE